MKPIIILLAFLCNVSLLQTSVQSEQIEVNSLRILNKQVIDSASTNDLRIRRFHLEIIPPSSGVQFYRNGIIFLSHSKLEEKVPERHLSFGSIKTYASLVSDTIPSKSIPFDLNITTLFPIEATTFSNDFNTMYLSLIPEKLNKEKIFKAEYTSNGWKIEETSLAICNDNSIYSHPCLSADEKFMIFSSDRPGTKGGLDLWITEKEENGWSDPQNLGNQINTAGNELFAALDSRNNLYFSSDGHPGKGGYDIFVTRYTGSGWDNPHILPSNINTLDDELAYTINKTDSKAAFYTSRARSGKPRTQIYIIDLNQDQSKKGSTSLDERMLALAGINDSNIEDESDLTSKTTEVKKETVNADKPHQPAPQAEARNQLTPPSEKVQGTQTSEAKKDEVVFRVQIIASTKPVGSQNITVAGKSYKSFEYLYKGGYRTTIGEFSSLHEAIRLQNICRQNGYSQAFVVAFKNNIRSTDPELFK